MNQATQTAGSAHGLCRLSKSPTLSFALQNDSLARMGLVSVAQIQQPKTIESTCTDPYARWCGKGEIVDFPLSLLLIHVGTDGPCLSCCILCGAFVDPAKPIAVGLFPYAVTWFAPYDDIAAVLGSTTAPKDFFSIGAKSSWSCVCGAVSFTFFDYFIP